MTNEHSRIPSAFVLVAATYLGLIYAGVAGGSAGAAGTDGRSLQQLERAIVAPDAPARAWADYGQKLAELKQDDKAAQAFARALQLDPTSRPARFGRAVALARAGRADDAYRFLRATLYSDPRLVEDLFDRPELKALTGEEPRFATLAKEAHMQAMD